jgi:hypothetical protein
MLNSEAKKKKIKVHWTTSDGTVFDSLEAAEAHEYLEDHINQYKKWLKSRAGQECMKHYGELETGIWEVRGEDPNPCPTGPHGTPLLGYFEGTFRDAAIFGCSRPAWKVYGDGGTVRKLTIIKGPKYRSTEGWIVR